MFQYVIKRVLLFIPTLIIITVITFLVCRLAPGDPTEMRVGQTSEGIAAETLINQQAKDYYKKKFGLDKPIYQQYLIWMKNMIFEGDFGNSFKDDRPVIDKIMERLPITITIQLASIFLIYIIAIPIGIYSAVKQYSFWDKTSTVILFVLYSLPSFWVATLAIIFLCNVEYLKIFPASGIESITHESMTFIGKLWDRIWHLMLPVIVLSLGSFAFLSKQMRSAMLETIRQDYIRTAKAKGLENKTVIYKHALRNSLIPIITLLASIFPAMVGGSFIIEQIFSIPGIGQLGIQGIFDRDYPLIMALLVLSSVLTIVGVLVADLLYAVVDPRIAYTKKQ
ncbi:MAG: ABC transporter permease [Ignavibacteriaceae bacterium]|jgi:peptide/nickel transport system permease protein|nr:MAG: ABC transporter permease [Chlorobiota bacterium]KXK05864.1 MAG: peptide/nickel transport system permease protein [Chlorobi bacterium OLB4]MBV6398308.1 Inner membrane ABC transporter permease protein YejB [Ignavibacteria bacterium]MCC6886101.1 ABC transporter permease [Ignavibacteriales bacterium]MCE7952647.1 ABC transporter permease [Chlorobi bacterium CHB7]MDL1886759.1 ABC transporter permease [Ignavibacteria bacterium CHB1]MEB2329573.1 ABC transporter permease [Ignavibacteriaceae ba